MRVLQQERDVERQHRREGLELAAGSVALEVERRLADIEEQLARGSGIRLTTGGLEAPKGSALLYGPVEVSAGEVPADFAPAEALEFQRRDFAGAAAAYRPLAQSAKPAIRAAALSRLGRVLRKAGDRAAALDAYDRLLQLGPVPVGEQPAALLARQARCQVFQEAGDAAALHREAADLAAALYAGGWRIERSTFELYRDLVQGWGAPPPPADALA